MLIDCNTVRLQSTRELLKLVFPIGRQGLAVGWQERKDSYRPRRVQLWRDSLAVILRLVVKPFDSDVQAPSC